MNFIELAEKIIKEENKPLTQNEIWELAKFKGYDKFVNTSGKTPWNTIGARLYVDIRDNPSSKFIKLKLKPTRFFLKSLLNNLKNIDPQNISSNYLDEKHESKIRFKERDLHKFLSYFVYTYRFIYTKTIYHEESNKKQFSQWLHPDIVGVYFPLEEWENEILDIAKEIGSVGIKFFFLRNKKRVKF